jgi:hypothetical protein
VGPARAPSSSPVSHMAQADRHSRCSDDALPFRYGGSRRTGRLSSGGGMRWARVPSLVGRKVSPTRVRDTSDCQLCIGVARFAHHKCDIGAGISRIPSSQSGVNASSGWRGRRHTRHRSLAARSRSRLEYQQTVRRGGPGAATGRSIGPVMSTGAFKPSRSTTIRSMLVRRRCPDSSIDRKA